MQELILLGLLDSWLVVSSKRKKVMKLTRSGGEISFSLGAFGSLWSFGSTSKSCPINLNFGSLA